MSYQPYNRNTSGIVFFGEQGSQQTYYSDSNFLIEDGAAGNIQAPNFKVANGGNIGSVGDPDAIAIASNGNVSLTQDLTIAGDLTVNGTTTSVNTTNLTVADPLIFLGSGNTTDSVDLGFFSQYSDDAGTTLEYAGLFRDADDEKYRLFHSLQDKPTTTVDTGGTGYTVATLVANLEGNADTATESTNVTVTANNTTNETVYLTFVDGATGTQGIETDTALNYNPSTDTLTAGTFAGNLTGDVTGNADTATALATARDISLGDQMTGSASFDGTANITINAQATPDLIQDQVAETSPSNDDLILILDSGTSLLRKMTRGQFVSGLGAGSMDSFNITGDAGTPETINDGNTLDIAGGSGIQTVVGATDTVTVNVKVDASTINIVSDTLEVADNGITATQLNTSVAGLGITGGGGTALAFAPSELTDAAIANGDSLVFMDNTDSNAPKVEALADVATLFAGVGLTATNSVLAVNAGVGLVANGDNIDVDLSEFSAVTLASGDSFATLDSDGANEQRTTIMDLGAYLAGGAGSNLTVNGSGQLFASAASSFTAAGDSGSDQTIESGDTLTMAGGTGINTVGSATDTVTFNLNLGSLNGTETTLQIGDSIAFVDSSDSSASKRITFANFSNNLAGDGLTNGGGAAALDVNAGAGLEVVSDAVRIAASAAGDGLGGGAGSALSVNVDTTTIEIAADTLQIATGAAGNGLTGGGGSALDVNVDNSTLEINLDTVRIATGAAGDGLTGGGGSALAVNVDDSTIEISADTVQVKDNGITESKMNRSVVVDSAASTTMADSEDVSLVNASSNAVTVTLPSVDNFGRVVRVKKTDSSSNVVTVQGATGNIDNASDYKLYSQYESVTLITDGSDWWVI